MHTCWKAYAMLRRLPCFSAHNLHIFGGIGHFAAMRSSVVHHALVNRQAPTSYLMDAISAVKWVAQRCTEAFLKNSRGKIRLLKNTEIHRVGDVAVIHINHGCVIRGSWLISIPLNKIRWSRCIIHVCRRIPNGWYATTRSTDMVHDGTQ